MRQQTCPLRAPDSVARVAGTLFLCGASSVTSNSRWGMWEDESLH